MSTVGKHTQPISGFSPLSFGGCVLWLDAASPSNFALSGSNITTWYDRSPFSNHATPCNGTPILSNGAINGRSAVYLSNAPSLAGSVSASNAGLTGFIIVKPLIVGPAANWKRWFSGSVPGTVDFGDTRYFYLAQQGGASNVIYNRANAYATVAPINPSNVYMMTWTYDGLSNSLFLNGDPASTTPTSALSNSPFAISRYAIGDQVNPSTETLSGFVAEAILYDDYLQPAQRQAVEGYLAWKWGLAPSPKITFSPLTSLSNCAIWFDGADSNAFTLSGSNITTWRDKAGSNTTSNIGTPVLTSNAINGVQGVLLDVSSGFQISPLSNAANTTTLSVYGVVTAGSNVQGNARIFTVGRISDGTTNNDFTASNLWVLFRGTNGVPYFQHAGGSVTSGTSYFAIGTPCLASIIFSGTTATLWLNGTSIGSINTTNTLIFDRMGIGKNINANAGSSFDSFAGTVGECVMFYAAHTESQRLQVESYLASKWNVPMRSPPHLAPTHSYIARTPSVRGFQPTDIPGCAFWLDAGDPSTLTLSSSNTLTGWTDKAKDKRVVTVVSAPTYSSNGFNGLPTLQFTSGQYLSSSTASTFSNAYTMFQVAQTTGSSYQISLAVGGTVNPFVFWWRGDFNSYTANQEATGGQGNDRYTTTNVPMLHSCVVNSNSPYWWYYTNGIKQVNGNLGGYSSAPLSNLGGSNVYIPGTLVQFGGPAGGGFTGNISEVILFSNALTNSQRLQVEAYLATKWGLRNSFPAVTPHPFKYGPWGGLPTTIPGCVLWLDSADTSTITLSGSNVTQWNDKSGNGLVAISNSSNALPTFTSNTVQFAPSQALLVSNMPYRNTWTCVVAMNTVATGVRWLISPFPDVFQVMMGMSQPNSGDKVFSGKLPGMPADITGRHIEITTGSPYAWVRDGTQLVSNSTVDTTVSTTVRLGIGANGDGGFGQGAYQGTYQFYEMMVFSNVLTTAQRQQIEGYLAWKWGISSNLPGSAGNWVGLYRPLTSEFDPRSLGNCRAWFDASDPATIQFASGSNILRWLDKSGEQNHQVTNSTGGNYPTLTPNTLNGRPVVSFNGASAMIGPYFTTTMTDPQTVFVVTRPAALTGTPFVLVSPQIFYLPNGPPPLGLVVMIPAWTSGGWMYSSSYGDTNGVSNALIASTTRTDIVSGSWKPNLMCISVNGTEYGSSSLTTSLLGTKTANLSKISIGAGWYAPDNYYRNWYTGYVAEILIYTSFLTSADRQRIEGYLAWKWGLQSQLPSNHLYSNAKF